MRAKHEKLNVKLNTVKEMIKAYKKTLSDQRKHLVRLDRSTIKIEQARDTIHLVAKKTQEVLEYNLNDIVSKAMGSVFDDPYEVKVEFVVKRNKTEAEIWFVRNGVKYSPLTSTGGGTVDVASFALKLALWSLKAKRTRKLLIFDEPFRNINDPSRELHRNVAAMAHEITNDLGVQMLIVSLEGEMLENCDKSIKVVKDKNNKSVVE